MFHIDSSGKIIKCCNTWDCTAPSKHFYSVEEAEENIQKIQ